ncbi:MAG: VCBS domain-containing protein, partial [Azonexus sp.]
MSDRFEIFFIDPSVPDHEALLAGMAPGAQVIWLDGESDGLRQIASVLEAAQNVDAIHIVSHGAPGSLVLGAAEIDLGALAGYAEQMAVIEAALSDDGDILLYGCNVAEGVEGAAFINALAAATGADVAASTDVTGAAALGGDWALEAATGAIGTTALAIDAFDGTLASGILQNKYVRFGYSDDGTLGVGGNSKPGIQYDANGTRSFSDTADSLTPGSPYEGFTVKVGTTQYSENNAISGGAASQGTSVLSTALTTVGSDTYGSVTFRTERGGLRIDQTYTLAAVDSKVISMSVRMENISGSAVNNVSYARFTDPDVDSNPTYRTSSTNNTRGATGIDGSNIVLATGPGSGWVIGLYSDSSFAHNTAVDNGWSSDPATYLAGVNDGNGDYTIGIGFNLGNFAVGESKTFSFAYVFAASAATLAASVAEVPAVNAAPTLTSFAASVDTVAEDTQVEITYAELAAQGNEADDTGVTAFVVKAVSSGTLKIGASAGVATAWVPGSNETVPSDGSLKIYWTPAADANGTLNAFTVVAKDAAGAVSTSPVQVQVSVTAVNDAPTLASNATLTAIDEDAAVNNGSSVSALFGARFGDVDSGQTLGGIVVTGNAADAAAQGEWQYKVVGGTWHAISTSVSESSGLVLSAGTQLRFVPVSNYNGTPGSLTVHAADSAYSGGYTTDGATVSFNTTSDAATSGVSDGTRTLSVTVNAVNDAPIFTNTAGAATLTETAAYDAVVTTASGALTGTLTASDVESASNLLAFSVRGGDLASGTWSKAGLYGTLTVNASTGAWTYTPTDFVAINALAAGTTAHDVFDFKVSDPQGAYGLQALDISLQGTNDTPRLSAAIADQSFSGSGSWTYQIPVASMTDAEGTGLTYTVQVVDGSGDPVDVGAGVGVLPGWLVFDESTRTFSGNPTAAWGSASLNLKVTAADTEGAAVSNTFSLTLSNTDNQPPVVANPLTWKAINAPHEVTAVTFTGSLGGTTMMFDGQTVTLGTAATGAQVATAMDAAFDADALAGTPVAHYVANVKAGVDNENVLVLTAKEFGARTDFIDAATSAVNGGHYTVAVTTEGVTGVAEKVDVDFRSLTGATSLSFDGRSVDITNKTAAQIASAVASDLNASSSVWSAVVDSTSVDVVHLTARNTGAVTDLTAASFDVTATTLASPSVTQGAAAVASTATIDVTDAQADTAQTFAITIAGVNSGNPITIADLSAASNGTTLAAAIQTTLQTYDANLSVSFTGSQIVISDSSGRTLSDLSLKDSGVEIDPAINVQDIGGPSYIATIDVTDAQADTAQTFAITIAGVNSGNPITIANLSAASNGATLAAAIEAALRTADGNTSDLSVSFASNQIVISDSSARLFTSVSLKTAPAEIDNAIDVSNGSVAQAEVATVTFAAANGEKSLAFEDVSVVLTGNETAVQVATAFAAVAAGDTTNWNVGYVAGSSSITLTNKVTGNVADLTASAFTSTVSLADSVAVTLQGVTAVKEVVELAFDGAYGGATVTVDGVSASAGSAVSANDVATAVAGATYPNYTDSVSDATVTFTAVTPGVQTDIAAGDFTGTYTGTPTPSVTTAGSGWSYAIPANTFSDPEGDALTYSAYTINPDTGAATLLADSASLTFVENTATLSGNGTAPSNTLIEIRATDVSHPSTYAATQFQLVIYNDSQANSLVAGVVPASVSFVDGAGSGSYTVASTAFNYLNTSAGSLTYSATLADGSALPSWLAFNSSTGTFTGNPPAGTDDLSVKVTATSGGNSATTSSFTLVVDNANDPIVQTSTLPDATASAGGEISILVNKPFTDPDGSATGTATQEGISYTATANGLSLASYGLALSEGSGATAGKLLLTGNMPAGVPYLDLVVTGTETIGGSTATTSFRIDVGSGAASVSGISAMTFAGAIGANSAGAVTITGTPTQGQTLTAQAPTDADGISGAVNYQWQVSADSGSTWADVIGSRGQASTLTLAQSEAGKQVRVQAFYTDDGGIAEAPVSSARTIADLPEAGSVAVTGALVPGETLNAVVSDADGLVNAAPTYQWQVSVDGTNWSSISGATYSAYTLANADGGKYFRVLTSYTDDMGNTETNVTSISRGPVQLGAIAPVAGNDTGSATEKSGLANATAGSEASGNLVTNDSDANSGDTLTVSSVRTGATEGFGSEATDNGTTLTLDGNYGTLTVTKATGAYSYAIAQDSEAVQALNSGDSLTDSFNYSLTDATLLSDTAALTITINGANDLPVLTGAVTTTTVAEDVATAIPLDGLRLIDPDSAGGALRLTVTAGTLRAVSSDDSVTITGSDTNTLTLSSVSTFSLGAWLADNSVYFITPPNTNGAAVATLSYSLNDGSGWIDSGSTTEISATATNDAPIVDAGGAGTAGNNGTTTFKPRGDAVLIAPSLVLSDIDSTNLTSATVTLAMGARDNQFGTLYETLSLTLAGQDAATVGGLTVTSTPGSSGAVLTITGSATLATYQAILRDVLYNNSNPNAFSGDRTVTISVTDAAGQVANAASFATTTTNANIAVGQRIFIDGVDSGALVAQVLDTQHFVASRPLTALDAGDTLSFRDNTGLVTTATAAGPLVSTVTVAVPWTPVVDMNGEAAGRNNTVSYIEQASPVAIAAADASITDQGGLIRTVTVTLTNPLDNTGGSVFESLTAPSAGVLAWLNERGISISGNGTGTTSVAASGVAVSYDASGLSGATVLTFTSRGAGSDATNFQVAVRGVGYQNLDDAPDLTQRVVSVASVDVDSNVGIGANTYINLTAVNDAPVGVDSAIAVVEDTARTFLVSDFGFSDPLDGTGASSLLAVTITTLPASGTLTLDGVPVTAGQSVSVIDINANKLVFVPAADVNGDAQTTFTFQVQDSGGSANGGVSLDASAATMTVNIAPANDAPLLTANGADLAPVNEDANSNAGQLVSTLLGSIGDVDATQSPSLSHGANNGELTGMAVHAISTGNISGNWQYNLNDANGWQAISLTTGNALLLRSTDLVRFVPDTVGGTTANTLTQPSLSYYAWDQSAGTAGSLVSTANRGGTTALSTLSDTVAIAVTDVNDAPTISAPRSYAVDFLAAGSATSLTGFDNISVDIAGKDAAGVAATFAAACNASGSSHWSAVIDPSDASLVYFTADANFSGTLSGSDFGYVVAGASVATASNIFDAHASLSLISFSGVASASTITFDGLNISISAGATGATVAQAIWDAVRAAYPDSYRDLGSGNIKVQSAHYALYDGPGYANASNDLLIDKTTASSKASASSFVVLSVSSGVGASLNSFSELTTGSATIGGVTNTLFPIGVVEDGSAVINGVTLGDIDITSRVDGVDTNNNVTATLSVSHGTITLGSTDAIEIVAGTNGSASLALSGSLAAVNAAIAAINYTPTTNFNGVDTLVVSVSDQGNVGGDALSATANVAIIVSGINDAPVAVAAGPNLPTINENAVANSGTLVSDLVNGTDQTGISDADGDSAEGTEGVGQGIAVVSLGNTGPGVGSWEYHLNAGGNWVAVPQVDQQHALLLPSSASLRFVPDAQNATTSTVTYYLWDGATGSAAQQVDVSTRGGTTAFSSLSDTASITVTPVNDAPTLDLNGVGAGTGETAVFSPRGNAVALFDNDLTLGDVDSGDVLTHATLVLNAGYTLDNQFGTTYETLATTLVGGVYAGSLGNLAISGNGTQAAPLQIVGEGTAADYKAALLTLVYNNTNPNAFSGVRPVTVTIYDNASTTVASGDEASAVATLNVDVNWGAVVDLNGEEAINRDYVVSYTENAAGVAIAAADASLVDQDGNIASVTVTLSNHPDGSAEKLFISDAQVATFAAIGITVSGNNTHAITLTGDADGTYFQLALRAIQYANSLDSMDTTARLVNVTTVDVNGNTGVPATTTINPLSVNDAPTGAVSISNTTDGGRGITTARQGDVLSVANTLADADGMTTSTVTYQWMRGGVAIDGATNATYTLAQADVGAAITVVASYTDDDGYANQKTSSATNSIVNVNDAPVITSVAQSGAVVEASDLTGTVTGSAYTVTDADPGDSHLFSVPTAPAYGTATINSVTGAWSYAVSASNATVDALRLGQTLNDTFIVRVTDNGTTAGVADVRYAEQTVTITITGTNDAPVAVADTRAVVEDASVINGSVATNDSDVDSAAVLTYVPAEGQAAVAGLIFNSDGSYSFDPAHPGYQTLAAGATRDVVFNYTVSDQHGATANASLTITVTGVNDTPVAVADARSVTEDATAITGSVATNDSDVDTGATLSYAAAAGQVAVAGLTFNNDGSYSFDPSNAAYQDLAEGESREVAFNYTVSDGTATDTDTLTISVSGINDRPVVAVVDVAGAVTEDAAATLSDSGSVTFSDADATDVLTSSVELVTATASGGVFVYAGLQAGLAEAMSLTQTGTNDGSIGWSFSLPNADAQYLAHGVTVTAIYRITLRDDSGTASAAQTQDVTVVLTGSNDGPFVNNALVDQAAPEDSLFTYNYQGQLRPSFDDADLVTGDVLTFSATQRNGDPLPAWLSINSVSGVMSGTPDIGDVGELDVKITATDSRGLSAFDFVKVTIAAVNDAPRVTGVVSSLADGTEDLSYGITATALLTGITDQENDSLSVSALSANHGTVTDNGNGTYTLVPAANYSGVVTLSYNVIDGNGGVLAQTRTITLANVNDTPTGSVTISGTATQGETLTAANTLADADGLGALTYTWKADGTTFA